jgi:hypothetical protein
MVDYGRLATPPRLLFCFYRNPLRSDLNPIKKVQKSQSFKELIFYIITERTARENGEMFGGTNSQFVKTTRPC